MTILNTYSEFFYESTRKGKMYLKNTPTVVLGVSGASAVRRAVYYRDESGK